MALPDLRLSRPVPGTAGATLAEIDPRFEHVALCRDAGPIEIISAADAHRQQVLPAITNLPVYLGWWSHDGRFLAAKRNYPTEDDLGDLEIWNVEKAERLAVIRDVEFLATAFHPKLPRILFATAGGWIVTRDLELGTEISRFQLRDSPKLLIYSPDGLRFAASYERTSGGMVSVNQADHGRELMSRDFSDFVIGLAWHPNGRWISTADFDGGVQLLDSHNGESRLLGRHKAQGATVVFSGDGEYLLSGGWERELICWDMRRMERAFTIALESFKAKFRADGLECATLADDGIQIHAFERPAGRREMVEDLGPLLRQAAFSPDGHWVAAAAKKRAGIWDLSADGAGIVVDQPEQARLYFSAGDELFGSRDDGAFDWQVSPAEEPAAPPKLEKKPPPETHGFTSLCLTSSEVVVTDQDGSRTCPLGPAGVAAGDRVPTATGLNGVSRDGRWVGIFRPFTPRLHLYRLPGFVEGATLTNRANVLAFEFSPTSGEVAVSSAKGVEIWNPATGQRLRELTNFVGLLYGPDGKTCWLTHDFRNAGLYDLRSLQLLLPLPVGSLPLALSPDGRRLAVSVDGKRLQVWDLAEARERLRELGLDWAD
jgi:WD40 repeat protein